ncbi:MAG TPA: TIGR00730 family Rossman fold protein [Mucilaginibacter sp.]
MANDVSKSEIVFLDGPHSRFKELRFTLDTMWEFIKGFRALHFIGPCITVFGSARFNEEHPYYELTRKAAAEFAKLGFTIMTGGGPGLMEAANRGAKDVGGKSVACNIQLPVEQKPNRYLDKWVYMKHFFIRKVLLVKYSFAFVVMPGGFGTMDEYFEALTLIQTHKIDNFPVIIFGKAYHRELVEHINQMKLNGTIGPDDTKLYLITDDIQEAVNLIAEKSIKAFGLKPANPIKPIKWLLEHI